MNIVVYLGASDGFDAEFQSAATRLGEMIAESGNTLVYGGSKSGLMGRLAIGALSKGGRVIGIEPRIFIDDERQLDDLTELIVTDTFTERKTKMKEMGDAFIAFPGGTGTLDEISEIMCDTSLGFSSKPCVLLNLDGYYDGLKALLSKAVEKGYSSEKRLSGITFCSSVEEAMELVNGN